MRMLEPSGQLRTMMGPRLWFDSTVVQLHPLADMCLVVPGPGGHQNKYKVSSHVLVGASNYFARLFNSKSGFSEGDMIRRGECPEFTLYEDDPRAVYVILAILHYGANTWYDVLEPELLASVALHSDKYQCTGALAKWVQHWFSKAHGPTNAEEHGLMLSAAYLFNSRYDVLIASTRIIQELAMDFDETWLDNRAISRVPPIVTGRVDPLSPESADKRANKTSEAIADRISDVLDRLHFEIQWVEKKLQKNQEAYLMPFKLCSLCGRLHPKCYTLCLPCKNDRLFDSICAPQSRVGDYFTIMRKVGLWPSVEPFRDLGVTTITYKIERACEDPMHICDAGDNCPLKREMRLLLHRARLVSDQIIGIDIEQLR